MCSCQRSNGRTSPSVSPKLILRCAVALAYDRFDLLRDRDLQNSTCVETGGVAQLQLTCIPLLHNYTQSYQAVIYPHTRRPRLPLARSSPRGCCTSHPSRRRLPSSGVQSFTFIGAGAAAIDGNNSCISRAECICGRRFSSCGWSLFVVTNVGSTLPMVG